MSRDGEEFQPGNDAGQGGQWQQRENIVFLAVFFLVSGLIIIPYKPPWSQSVQSSLAHGAAMYALAVAAALSFRVVARLSVRLPKLALASLLLTLLMVPPVLGSLDIAYGLIQVVGNRVEGGDAVWVLLLYVLTALPLALFVRRTTPHI